MVCQPRAGVAVTTEPAARTFGRAALGRGKWIISNLEPHVAVRFKQLFPRVPKGSAGPFELPSDNVTGADLVWFMDRYPLDISAQDTATLAGAKRAYLGLLADMERILIPKYQAPPYAGLRDGQNLRHYQAQAIELAALSGGLLLGDECGLGKTYTAAGFCLAPERGPAAVVCTVHIQSQWVDVIKRFTTLRVHSIKGTKPYSLPPADVYVFRYTQLAGWVSVFDTGALKTVIYDEPQELRRGTDSSKGCAAAVLSDRAQWRLGLTATPIYNYGAEIYNIMRFIDRDMFGDWHDFQREYLDVSGRLKDPRAVGSFLRERHAFLRRLKSDVGGELPPVNRIVDVVEYEEAAVRSIEETARALAIKATTGSFVERGQAARDLDIMVRQATGVAKAKAVAAIVRILIESGEPVVLMGWHRAVYDIWLTELKDLSPAMYTGSESPTQKNAAKDAFVSGKTDLLIMSLRSAAGLDGLQARCSTMVFGELDWSPGIHHQCIERLDREGQTKPVMALFLVAEDGSDPPMMEVLGLKASEAYQVIDPTGGVQAAHSDRDGLTKLVQRYLGKKHGAAPVETPTPAPVVALAERKREQSDLFV